MSAIIPGGENAPSENELTKNAPTNSDLWTDSGNYATAFDNEGEAGIDGTTGEKAYEIRTAEQLALLAYRINTSSTNSTYKSLYYVQTADIDLSLYYWDAIGYSSSYYFSGHYDGGEYTISGLYTEAGSSSTYSYQGLFGYVVGQSETNMATIKNVGITDSNIQGYQNVGGVVGYVYSYSTVTNCYNTGSVSGSGDYVGGIIGSGFPTITNCYNSGVVSGRCDVGGIIGSGSPTITNCYNSGVVSGWYDVGGIIGRASNAIITNCHNIGDISERTSRAVTEPDMLHGFAGIVGFAGFSTMIVNCYNTGTVSGSSNPVGGVVGASLRWCYYHQLL